MPERFLHFSGLGSDEGSWYYNCLRSSGGTGFVSTRTPIQARMEISPTKNTGAAYFAMLPADVGSLSFQMVAGAGFEPATFGL